MNQEGRNRKEKPKWDAFHFRLPREKDQLKFIELYRRSGAKTKTDFIRRRVLGEEFHVVTTDASKEEYYRTLTVYLAQLHKLGVLYNQAVRTLNSYHSAVVAKNIDGEIGTAFTKDKRQYGRGYQINKGKTIDDSENQFYGKSWWCLGI